MHVTQSIGLSISHQNHTVKTFVSDGRLSEEVEIYNPVVQSEAPGGEMREAVQGWQALFPPGENVPDAQLVKIDTS